MKRTLLPLAALAAAALLAGPARAQTAIISQIGLPSSTPGEQIAMDPNTQAWCMTASSTRPGNPVVLSACRPLTGSVQSTQTFRFTRMGTGPIRHLASGLCVDARQSDGALILWSCHRGWNQQFTNTRGDELRLRNPTSGQEQCVDVPRGEARAGAALIVYTCHGATNQTWLQTGG